MERGKPVRKTGKKMKEERAWRCSYRGRISEARRGDIPGGRVSCAKYTEKSNSKTETPAWVDNQEIIVKVLVAQLCLTF